MGVALGMIFYEVARKLSGVSGGTRSIVGKSKGTAEARAAAGFS
jgi:hypothetical protein